MYKYEVTCKGYKSEMFEAHGYIIGESTIRFYKLTGSSYKDFVKIFSLYNLVMIDILE